MKKTETIKFGKHMIFDAYGCDYKKLSSKETCLEILSTLCKMAGMHPLAEPFIVKAEQNETLGGKDPGGWSGFLIIQESHISIHTFAKRGFVTLDMYSCKEFNTNGLLDYLRTTLKPDDIDVISLDRGLKYPTENIY
jgi:S-adenosylmethionine decarboxylase